MSSLEPQILISLQPISAYQTRPSGTPSDLSQPVHLASMAARGSNKNTISISD